MYVGACAGCGFRYTLGWGARSPGVKGYDGPERPQASYLGIRLQAARRVPGIYAASDLEVFASLMLDSCLGRVQA